MLEDDKWIVFLRVDNESACINDHHRSLQLIIKSYSWTMRLCQMILSQILVHATHPGFWYFVHNNIPLGIRATWPRITDSKNGAAAACCSRLCKSSPLCHKINGTLRHSAILEVAPRSWVVTLLDLFEIDCNRLCAWLLVANPHGLLTAIHKLRNLYRVSPKNHSWQPPLECSRMSTNEPVHEWQQMGTTKLRMNEWKRQWMIANETKSAPMNANKNDTSDDDNE